MVRLNRYTYCLDDWKDVEKIWSGNTLQLWKNVEKGTAENL